jgi:putative DNA primase/helicase
MRPPIIIPPALAPLAKRKRFVGWKWENGENGKLTKVPYRGHTPNRKASSKNPATWCLLDDAMRAYSEGKVDGIGFVLTNSGVTAIDIDDCRAKTTGIIAPWASELIKHSGSYAEITPSEEGVRIIGLGRGKHLHRKFSVPNTNGVSCELYRRATRVITITGQQLGTATKLAKLDALLDGLYAELSGAKQKRPKGKGAGRKRDLDELIRDGEGGHFGGDRSRAVWFVINRLLEQGKSADEIVAVLIDPANGISAHCLDQPEPERYARRQVEKAQQERTGDPDAEIERLAKLSAVDYERARKEAAEKLGMRASILDRLVTGERTKLGFDKDDGKQGHAVTFPEPEPWPQPVDGAALLGDLASTIRSHVVMSDHARDISALWAVHTYLIKRFKISPKLSIRSPVRRCGKTTLLEVLAELVFRAWSTGSITKAALFRVIEMYHPTLLIDEIDTFVGEDEELRGMLNHGHKYDGTVTRTVGEDHQPRKFDVYAAVALAGIGGLADTLADRSVLAELKRRRPSDTIARLRIGRTEHLHELRRRIVRWVADHEARIAERDPEIPSIIDREADNWQVLLAIADEAGGEWPERARKVAVASHGHDEDGDNVARLELLLWDIRKIFAEEGTEMADMFGATQVIISSAKLVKALAALEGHPWAEMGRERKPLTPNGLAWMLKPLAIAPGKVGPRDKRVNGYVRAHFTEAFERYLPGKGANRPDTQSQPDEMDTSEISRVDTEENGVHSGNARNPDNDGPASEWPVYPTKNGGKAYVWPTERSSDLPYDGPVVAVPDQGPDPLDEHGTPQATKAPPPPLTPGRARDLRAWSLDWATARQAANLDFTTAQLEAELRIILRGELPPDEVEAAIKQVVDLVFMS